MNFDVTVDWRFVGVLGASVAVIILVTKMDSAQAEEVLIHGIDASEESMVAVLGDR